jgi:hypothetical protein
MRSLFLSQTKIKVQISLFLILFPVICVSCNRKKVPINEITLNDSTKMVVKDWKVLGPFYRSLNDTIAFTTFEHDDLTIFNTTEKEITSDIFKKICGTINISKLISNFHLKSSNCKLQSDIIRFKEFYGDSISLGKMYMGCILRSAKDQHAAFYSYGIGGMKAWVNNNLIYSQNRLQIENVRHFSVFKLKKGDNFLLVRLNRRVFTNVSWEKPQAIINLSSLSYAKHVFFVQNQNNILKESILKTSDTLNILYPFSQNQDCRLTITDSNTKQIYDEVKRNVKNILIPFAKLNGIYKCKFICGNDTFKQSFICGNIEDMKTEYEGRLKKYLSTNDTFSINSKAQLIRLDHMIENKLVIGPNIYSFEIQTSTNKRDWETIFKGTSQAYTLPRGKVPIVPLKSQFIKVIGYGGTSSSFNSISEIAFYDNRGKSLKVQKIDVNTSFGEKTNPDYAVDNNLETQWSSFWRGSSLEFDFGNNIDINKVSIAWTRDIKSLEEVRDWQRKTVFIFNEINDILNNLDHKIEPLKNKNGFHIRGFRSQIDNEPQFYTIFIPDNYNNKPIPLVVFMPAEMGMHFDFLSSMRLADIDLNERLANEANRVGFAVLSPCCRMYEKERLTPVVTKDILEAINSVKQNYQIDTNRIYTTGVCAGADRAIDLATNLPEMFASMGGIASVANDKLYDRICNLYNLPLFFVHSDKDDHSPIEPMKNYVSKAKSLGLTAKMKVITDASIFSYEHESFGDMFKFFKANKRVSFPKVVKYLTSELKYNTAYWLRIDNMESSKQAFIEGKISNNKVDITTKNIYTISIIMDKLNYNKKLPLTITINSRRMYEGFPEKKEISFGISLLKKAFTKTRTIEGPINHIFSNNFIVVENSKNDQDLGKAIQAFKGSWSDYYCGSCPAKKDIDLTESDIENSNLIIFGDERNNAFLKKILPQLPLKISNDFITFCDKTYKGSISVCFIYPNPLNKKKYVFVVSTNKWNDFKFIYKNTAIEGTDDYIVWKNLSDEAKIIDLGNFNMYWDKDDNFTSREK